MNGQSVVVASKNAYEDIAIFAHLSDASLDKLGDLFSKVIKNKNSKIIEYKSTVKGIYIVVSGEVEVVLPGYDKPIAILGAGNCFGEMSLIEKGQTASATIQIHTNSAEFLFCKTSRFEKQINEDDIFANGFYKSMAVLMSSRLRQSNDKINNEIAKGVISAAKLVEDLELESKIQQTSEHLDDAGYKIVSKLSVTLAAVRELIKTKEISIGALEEICRNIEDIYYGESQKFDRLSQEMQLIQQYFDNLRRMIEGNRQLAVRGDDDLFHRNSN